MLGFPTNADDQVITTDHALFMAQHFPDRRLLVVFEPHTFSWRNRDALSWYDDVFDGAAAMAVFRPATKGADRESVV